MGRQLWAALLCTAMGFTSIPARAATPAQRVNVLFIALDDQNDWIGTLNGHPQVKTPNIDALAARGTLFTNAHAQAPVCNSSRVSLLTGLRPSTTGVYNNSAPYFRTVQPTRDLVSLPQYFARQGYQTFGVGKIFHYFTREQDEVEFQNVGPQTAGKAVLREKLLLKAPKPVPHPWVDWGASEDGGFVASDQQSAAWAEQQLERLSKGSRQAPFFLAVGFNLPHVPLYVPNKWFDLYPDEQQIVLPAAPEGDLDDLPMMARYLDWKIPEPPLSWLQQNDEWRALVRAYLAATSFTDTQVGRVLDALQKHGLSGTTVVVLWSDHGWHLGEKEKTGKFSLWERSTRVPLIFAGPGISAGSRSPRPAELLDIYPTLLELASLPRKPDLEGLSLVPQLKNALAPRERPAITTYDPGNHAVRSERWRYVRYSDGSQELYDHLRDPLEWSNLATKPQHAGVIKDLVRWVPGANAPHVPGTKYSILEKKDGRWFWRGELIDPQPR